MGTVTTDPRLSLAVSANMKLNLGNYESAEVFVSLSGVTGETTQAEVDELLNGPGVIAWEAIKATLRSRVSDVRQRRQSGQPA